MSSVPVSLSISTQPWQAGFLEVLPEIRSRAALCFRSLMGEAKEEAMQEAVASACVAFRSLSRRRCLGAVTAGTLTSYAVKHVRSGRHVGGSQEGARDVMSRTARRRRRVNVVSVEEAEDADCPWQPGLLTDKKTPVPDLVAFRIDFRHWLGQMAERDRRIIAALSSGEQTQVVAGRFGLTTGRVSQLRRKYELGWQAFQGEVSATISDPDTGSP